MEPNGSLLRLQEPATCPYPEPDQLSLCTPSLFLKIHLNIILPCMGLHSSAVGWFTMLQAGRWQVRFLVGSLEFFIDLILPASLWPRGQLRL
jgi:hypothetical protein